MGRAAGWLVAILASALALGTLGAGGLELWLRTERGRAFLAERLERALGRELRGSLRIGGIDRYDRASVVAHDVAFLDPRGQPVLELERVDLGLDLGALLSREARLRSAYARGVVVTLTPGEGGYSTSIEETFAGPPGRGGGGGAPFDVDTGTIHVEQASLVIAMGAPRVRFDELDGFVRVARKGHQAVKVRLDRIDGAWRLPGTRLLDEKRTFHATGRVDGDAEAVVDLTVRACFRRGEVPLRVRYGKSLGLRLGYDADDARLVGLALRAVDLVTGGTVEVTRASIDARALSACE